MTGHGARGPDTQHAIDEPTGHHSPHRDPRRWSVLAVGVAAQTTSGAINMGMAALAPAIQDHYRLTLTLTGVVLASISAGITLGLLPWGLLADRFGERAILAAGLGAAAACLVVVANADRVGLLVGALCATGICLASVIPSSGRAIMYWFAPSERGLAIGLRQTGSPLGALAAALVLPVVVVQVGLGAAFLVLAAACILAGVAVAMYLAVGTDAPGDHPLLRPFRDTRLWRLSCTGFLLFAAQAATVGFSVVFLHEARGMSTAAAGAALAAIQVGGAALRIGLGRWSDRSQRRIKPLRQLSVLTSAAVLAVALATAAPLPVTVTVLIVAGSLSLSTGGLLFTATAELAGRRQSGAALGLQQTILGLSATCTPIAFATVVSLTSWSMAFATTALFALAASVALGGPMRELDTGEPLPAR